MKKIFRMALVFALAGATLMYTGCTKDYGEEIDKLDSKLSNVESTLSSKLTDLEGQLSTLKSGVNALDAAYKAADDAIKGDVTKLQGRIAAVEDAIKDLDKLATKEELKDVKEALEKKIADDLKAVKDELLAKAQNLQDQIDAINAALKLKADADKVYTKEEVDAFLAKYYTQEEINAFLATKADKDAVFTKDEIVAFLAEKADKSAVYTKEEVDAFFAKYLTADQVQELLDKKADKDAVYTKDEIKDILKAYYTSEEIDKIFEDYYTANQVDELLKNYFTKDEINDLLKAYYTAEQIDKMFEEKLANYYTKAEIEELLEKYYTAEQIDKMLEEEFAKYYNKEEVDAFLALKADKEEVEAMVKEVQDNIDQVFELLSDELRSIVFLPDFYFAGVEATPYDFGSFLGFEILESDGKATGIVDYEGTAVTFPKGGKVAARLLCYRDKDGNVLFYKFDPETLDYVRDAAGNPVPAKITDEYKLPYYPGNFVMGQVGKARYNLNPSSFAVDAAEWSLEGRDVKYFVKGDETPWTPVFLDIEKDADGLATVFYEIENPEWLFSSVIGGVVKGVISWIGTIERVFDMAGYAYENLFDLRSGSYYNYIEYANKLLAAFEYGFNNVPTMHLVGKLDENRQITSDWHAIASTEELVSHLAFRDDNRWVAWEDCGLSVLEDGEKDLFYSAEHTLRFAPSVPVQYNGGAVDLAKLIAIHTQDYETEVPYAAYTIEEFNAKYPGFHFEFELVPYTLGGATTGEEYYGKIDGTMFTPCYVKSESKPVRIEIPADPESTVGISAVGRKPMVIATLVNDETGIVQTVGWFRIEIVKEIKEPVTIMLPEQPTVPYICGSFRLYTTWYDFSDFVLEQLGMEYKVFRATYDYDGVYTIINGKYVAIDRDEDGDEYGYGHLWVPNARNGWDDWGAAVYYVDNNGTGINDIFAWDVNARGVGEGNTKTIYYKFVNGDDVVYFGLTATIAERAHMFFVLNKIDKEWTDDIADEVAKNTALMNVPVPVADDIIPTTGGPGGDVMLFRRDINHWFVGYWPALGLKETSDPLYKNFFNTSKGKDPDAGKGSDAFEFPYSAHFEDGFLRYDDKELISDTEYFFDKNQPKIDGKYQLWTNWWGSYTIGDVTYEQGKLLYVAGKDELSFLDDEGNPFKVAKPVADNLIAHIEPRMYEMDGQYVTEDDEYEFVSDTLRYLDTKMAKQLLNLWSYTETDQDKMLYANILTKNTYGPCGIVTDDGLFHIRFVRPLDVNFADQDVAEESAVDGWNVELAKFISGIVDWNHQSVIVKEMVPEDPNKPNGKKIWSGYYIPNIIKTVNMYDYYRFTQLRVDIQKAEINNWDMNADDPSKAWDKLSTVLPKAKLQVGKLVKKTVDGVDYDVFEPFENPANPYVVDMTNFSNLKGIYLNYRNDEAISDEFDLRMPVEVDYAWGTLTAYMVIHVKDTGSTSPN